MSQPKVVICQPNPTRQMVMKSCLESVELREHTHFQMIGSIPDHLIMRILVESDSHGQVLLVTNGFSSRVKSNIEMIKHRRPGSKAILYLPEPYTLNPELYDGVIRSDQSCYHLTRVVQEFLSTARLQPAA